MGKRSGGLSKSKIIPEPDEIAKASLIWLKIKNWFQKSKSLEIVIGAKKALLHLPEGKTGIVLGSGGNTKSWKKKGWKTLDIKPESKADYIVDANRMEKAVTPSSQDYLFAEFISFDPTGKKGVIARKLIEQSSRALKIGGTLIIITGHHEGYPWPDSLPNKSKFTKIMFKNGFQTVLESHKVEIWAETVRQQRVIYYGKKLIELSNRHNRIL
jgi:predicted SAM-dependent methyltransferase